MKNKQFFDKFSSKFRYISWKEIKYANENQDKMSDKLGFVSWKELVL